MNAATAARWCISTSRSWAASCAPAIASVGTVVTRSAAPAGNSRTWPSTMPRAGPRPMSLPDERGGTAVGFLHRTVRCLAGLGVRVRAVMTDNGSCYRARRFRQACLRLGIRPLFTRPYTPRTNGKAERFIKTALHEWAYARRFPHSRERRLELAAWLHHYNWHWRHTSLGGHAPITRVVVSADNLVRLHS